MAEERLQYSVNRDYKRSSTRSSGMNIFDMQRFENQYNLPPTTQYARDVPLINFNGTLCQIVNGIPIPVRHQITVVVQPVQHVQPVQCFTKNGIPIMKEATIRKTCGIPNCKFNHFTHLCNRCGSTDSKHLEENCPCPF